MVFSSKLSDSDHPGSVFKLHTKIRKFRMQKVFRQFAESTISSWTYFLKVKVILITHKCLPRHNYRINVSLCILTRRIMPFHFQFNKSTDQHQLLFGKSCCMYEMCLPHRHGTFLCGLVHVSLSLPMVMSSADIHLECGLCWIEHYQGWQVKHEKFT